MISLKHESHDATLLLKILSCIYTNLRIKLEICHSLPCPIQPQRILGPITPLPSLQHNQSPLCFLDYSKLFPMTVFEPNVLIAWNAHPPDLNTVDFSSSFTSQFSHHLCNYPLILLISFITPVTPCILSVQFNSVAQLCPTLCDPMDCSTPGFPVHHQFPELTQTYVHWVSDAIQPSHLSPLLLLPSIFPSIRVFSNESALLIRWPKY